MSDDLSSLVVFVPMKPVNTLNAREHALKTHRRARKEKDALAVALLAEVRRRKVKVTASPRTPKRITFTVSAAQLFDAGDNLAAVCKHLRDELVPLGIIHADGPEGGHTFTYAQRVQKPHGVEIRVECGPLPGESA